MTNKVPNKIMEKIKKCLSLATSGNPHEAAAGLRQANKLMAMHGVTLDAVEDSKVGEAGLQVAKPGSSNIAFWKRRLAACAAKALGCSLICQWDTSGKYLLFVGPEGMPEMARYAYEVLERQLAAARTANAEQMPRSASKGDKRRYTNAYTLGWTEAVVLKVQDLAPPSEEVIRQTESYIRRQHGQLNNIKTRKLRETKADEERHLGRGYVDGQEATLYRPVDASKQQELTEHDEELGLV